MDELDELDIQILADLGSPSTPQWNVRTSLADLARRLGVDEETVRLRVKRARERGYMPPWRIRVNPHLLGHRPAGVDLEVGSAIPKSRAIAQLRLVEGVVLIVDYRGSGLMVLLWYPNEAALDRARRLVESICGAPSRAVWKGVFSEPSLQLRPIDWKILDVMKDDARMDLKEVAAALGVTLRTVQRRLRAMTEGRAIMLEGTPDVPKVGGVICDYLVHCPDSDLKRAADGRVPFTLQRIGATDTPPRGLLDHRGLLREPGAGGRGPCEAQGALRGRRGSDGHRARVRPGDGVARRADPGPRAPNLADRPAGRRASYTSSAR